MKYRVTFRTFDTGVLSCIAGRDFLDVEADSYHTSENNSLILTLGSKKVQVFNAIYWLSCKETPRRDC